MFLSRGCGILSTFSPRTHLISRQSYRLRLGFGTGQSATCCRVRTPAWLVSNASCGAVFCRSSRRATRSAWTCDCKSCGAPSQSSFRAATMSMRCAVCTSAFPLVFWSPRSCSLYCLRARTRYISTRASPAATQTCSSSR